MAEDSTKMQYQIDRKNEFRTSKMGKAKSLRVGWSCFNSSRDKILENASQLCFLVDYKR